MHGFAGPFFFGPALLFLGLLKFLFVIAIIMLIVRLVTHGHRAGYTHGGYGHRGYGPGSYGPTQESDPRRVAALRYASGQIDRAEFDRIISGLDAAAPSAPTPPSPPTAPIA